MKYGLHAVYTRQNYLNDIKECIENIMPDVIICVDLDFHVDHIATALLCEEALGIILKSNRGYYPTVLKTFAYEGAWFGLDDYWLKNVTKLNKQRHRFETIGYELDNPYCTEKNALRINVSDKVLTNNIKNSILYKAATIYKSQPLLLRLHKIINSDIVYWWRPTKNLMFNCNVLASSGDISYINDFKIIDCRNICSNSIEDYFDIGWIPEIDDVEKKITVVFDSKVSIQEFRIYETISNTSHITNIEIVVKQYGMEKTVFSGELKGKARGTSIKLTKKIENVEEVCFRINSFCGLKPGLSEIEIYEELLDNPSFLGSEKRIDANHRIIINKVHSCYYEIQYFFKFKLYFAIRKIKRLLNRKIKEIKL